MVSINTIIKYQKVSFSILIFYTLLSFLNLFQVTQESVILYYEIQNL